MTKVKPLVWYRFEASFGPGHQSRKLSYHPMLNKLTEEVRQAFCLSLMEKCGSGGSVIADLVIAKTVPLSVIKEQRVRHVEQRNRADEMLARIDATKPCRYHAFERESDEDQIEYVVRETARPSWERVFLTHHLRRKWLEKHGVYLPTH